MHPSGRDGRFFVFSEPSFPARVLDGRGHEMQSRRTRSEREGLADLLLLVLVGLMLWVFLIITMLGWSYHHEHHATASPIPPQNQSL
jgi:hypothetical protein